MSALRSPNRACTSPNRASMSALRSPNRACTSPKRVSMSALRSPNRACISPNRASMSALRSPNRACTSPKRVSMSALRSPSRTRMCMRSFSRRVLNSWRSSRASTFISRKRAIMNDARVANPTAMPRSVPVIFPPSPWRAAYHIVIGRSRRFSNGPKRQDGRRQRWSLRVGNGMARWDRWQSCATGYPAQAPQLPATCRSGCG